MQHGLLELLAVLGLVDDVGAGADHLDAELLQDAVLVQVHRGVEAGLAAERGQQGVGPFLLDDLGDDLPGDRLDVGAVGRLRIGHDGGRVRVDQDDLVALFAQGLAGLGAGIVELARLADDDGAGADEEDLLEVGAFRHAGVVPQRVGRVYVDPPPRPPPTGGGRGRALDVNRGAIPIKFGEMRPHVKGRSRIALAAVESGRETPAHPDARRGPCTPASASPR